MAAPNARTVADPGDWAGMVSHAASRSKNPTAMAVQVNVGCLAAGAARTRPGLRPLSFDIEPEVPDPAIAGPFGLLGLPLPFLPFSSGSPS